MASSNTNLFSMARSKLQSSVSKDNCSLHRWVLLKNSIVRSPTLTVTAAASEKPSLNAAYSEEDYEEDDEEEEADAFLFPDAGKLLDSSAEEVPPSEAQWFDSLLETLGDGETGDEDDQDEPTLPMDDFEEDYSLSPLTSPMSSSDDLLSNQQPAYYPPPIAVPYPVPYPPTSQHAFLYHHAPDSESMQPTPYADSLPYSYHDMDDEELSVPDAIEDTSDDESDVLPPTPSVSLTLSRNSSSPVDPASVPLPPDRHQPHVYIGVEDTHFFNPFDHDPLPFSEDHIRTYNPVYTQEC